MNMPGFTAALSIYRAAHYYSAITGEGPKTEAVQPQFVLPPWTPCRWLVFVVPNLGIHRAAKRGIYSAGQSDGQTCS